jgi:hypothetical protein
VGREVGAEGAPRTLRCRHSLDDAFGLAELEIRILADALESSVQMAVLKAVVPLEPKKEERES